VPTGPRSYHHGHLREAALAATLAEVGEVGAAGASLRQIARRAGVSHAALAYQFGDKAGLFTQVAIEGFRLQAEAIGAAAVGPDAFIDGGRAYIGFALTHPAHFEVMFRPDLCRPDDVGLQAGRDAAFAILFGSARDSTATGPRGDVTGLAVAGWALAHGAATLWLTGNLNDRLGTEDDTITDTLIGGLTTLGQLAGRKQRRRR
jgi:AcrR family transcriptional regulator